MPQVTFNEQVMVLYFDNRLPPNNINKNKKASIKQSQPLNMLNNLDNHTFAEFQKKKLNHWSIQNT